MMGDWEPTCHLRAVQLRRNESQLQQKWIQKSTGKEEWRGIPVIKMEASE